MRPGEIRYHGPETETPCLPKRRPCFLCRRCWLELLALAIVAALVVPASLFLWLSVIDSLSVWY